MKRIVLALIALVLVAAATPFAITEYQLRRTYDRTPTPLHPKAALGLEEGKRLAKLYGCTSCHAADYRGLEYNEDPALVQNFAPNLTLLAKRYSDAELAVAVRRGVRLEDGTALWGMPSATFATVTDEELAAVFEHLRSLPVGGKQTPPPRPGWDARLAILRALFTNAKSGIQKPAPLLVAEAKARPPADLGPRYAKGRHIATTVCSECHGSDLTGDSQEGGVDLMIAGAYDLEAFRHLLRTGEPPLKRDLGIMSQTAREDLKVFSDEEIDALHAYLAERAQRVQ